MRLDGVVAGGRMSEEANTVTGHLTADHRRLDSILEEVVRLAQAGDAAGALDRFQIFRAGLDRHIDVEEQLLFPMFEERSGVRTGPTLVMRSEHGSIRDAMKLIGTHLSDGALGSALAIVAQLTGLLERHNAKEEKILYPMSDRLAAADLPVLLRQMVEYQEPSQTARAG
jgi:hemerythrin-like domain-containing protein